MNHLPYQQNAQATIYYTFRCHQLRVYLVPLAKFYLAKIILAILG
jgi:hypothetical protein